MAMNVEEREKEIHRRRRAGSFTLPGEVDASGGVSYLVASESELRSVSPSGVYRVLLPEDIDPDVTASNVSWMIQRELKRGSADPVIARTLGQLDEFKQTLIYRDEVVRLVGRHVVAIAKTISNAADRLDECRAEANPSAGSVTKAGPSALAVEPLEGFDANCRAFFLFAKAAISGCTGLLVEGFRLKIEPGNFKRVVDEIAKISPEAADRLRFHDGWCKKITDARNAIEHPLPVNWLETRNFMLAPGAVIRPAFRHHFGSDPALFMDFEMNAGLILDKLLQLIEECISEVGFHRFELPWGVQVLALEETAINPESPFRLRAVLGAPPLPTSPASEDGR